MALGMSALRSVLACALASGALAAPESMDTSALFQRKEVPRPPAPGAGSDAGDPYLIGLRRESVPIYRRGKIASFKTSYSGVVSMGVPAQHFRVVFDTGSGNIVIPAAECKSEACKVEGRRLFHMRSSTSSTPINSDGSAVRPGELSEQVTIGFGTGEITGEFARDRVCFGTAAAHAALAADDEARAAAAASVAAANGTAANGSAADGTAANGMSADAAPGFHAAASAEAAAAAQATGAANGTSVPNAGAAASDAQLGAELNTTGANSDGGSLVTPSSVDSNASSEQKLCVEMNVVLAVEMSTQPFKTFKFDGILGLGLDGLAMSTNFSAFMTLFNRGRVPAARFGVFLTEGDEGEESEIAMGGYDPRRILEPLSYAPVEMAEYGYWQVAISAIRINGVELDICRDGTCRGVVDTGTSHLGIPAPADQEVGGLLTTEAGDMLDCRLADSPEMEIELKGYTLKLQAANYMRRLPLREGVTVSSPQGVHVPAIESNSTVPNPAAKAEQNYSLSEFHAYCAEGQDITTEEGCRAAASKLGLEFEHSWEGPADHHLCLFAQDGRDRVYFNIAGAAAATVPPNPFYRSVCAQAVVPEKSMAVAAAQEEKEEEVKRFCRPRLMPVRLPAPLGPKLFILGEPVLHRYYTVYDAATRQVGFALANNRRNTMDPASLSDRRGTLPKEVDMLLMQKGVAVTQIQGAARFTGTRDGEDDDMTILVQVTLRLSVQPRCAM